MQVWNKNRITPAPSTKNLTDEELKQQYGIHLTSRLGADGDGKESKWADIDDDEDDWAPDTIEWNDGTKSTLNPADMNPTPAPAAAIQAPEPSNERPKLNLQPSKILTSQFSSSVGPNATVLKVGGNAGKQQLTKTPTQLQKGPVEKPPSSASSTAPAAPPAKSPWAPLPPMEKVSPVIINPQGAMPPPPQRLPSGQGYFLNQPSATAPSPAKEISADDFNRNWRDSAQVQPRELYMPNSGRYEPVLEGKRRMSSKHDGNFRAPAVLQRPNGQSDPYAPAEPSAAFQTHRNSTDTARRRASSTLSGGSGQFARRMSMAKSVDGQQVPLEAIQARRDSSVFRPESRDGPPSSLQTPTYQARGPSPSYNFPQVSAQGQPTEDLEADKARQKILMKEKVELARKRKQEEEARLEAEKQERIKLKLASLGPLAEIQNKAVETPPQIAAEPVRDAPLPHVQSPPKPPVPQATGAPQQYGMMKVHPMDSLKQSRISPPQEQHSEKPTPKISPAINSIRPASESQGSLVDRSPRVSKASIGADARSGWNDQRSGTASNLWGPLNSNKALGNGTFDQGLAGYAPQELSSRASSTPQGWVNGRTPINDRSPQPQFASQHMPGMHPLPTVSMPEQTLAANSEVDSDLPISKPAPIGPPQTTRGQQNWQASQNLGNGQAVTGWNNFHAVASQQERSDDERAQRETAAKREEQLRTGIKQGPAYTFNETWKQVQVGEQAGQRAVTGINQVSIPAAPGFGAIGAPTGTRNSRFFPQGADARRTVTHSGLPQERSGSPSPPPAEEYASGHPAFDGDYQRPVIHFPREKPIVKLPQEVVRVQPPPPATPTQPMSWAARAAQPPQPAPQARAVSQPIVQNQAQNWQDRFSSLFAKDGKTPALAVASSSRDPLDVLVANPSAAVSLPPKQEVDYLKDAGKITSKEVGVEEEEDLFEDRETGDLPVVKPPVGPYKSPGPPVRRLNHNAVPASSYSKPAFVFFDLYLGSKDRDDESVILVKTHTMTEAIKRTRQYPGHPGNRSFGPGSRGRQSLGAPNKQNKQKHTPPKPRQVPEPQAQPSPRPQANTSRKVSGLPSAAHVVMSSPVTPASLTQPQSGSQKNSGASSPASTQLPNGTGPPNPRPQRNVSHHHRGGWQGKAKTAVAAGAPPKAQVQVAH
jgi:hypothetical protein